MKFYLHNVTKQIETIQNESEDILGEFSDQTGIMVSLRETQEEGLAISCGNGELTICYHRIPDLCRALLTVASMKQPTDIKEKCAFSDFGIMLDVSRNAVPRVDTIKQMIKYAAFMGYSFVGLYMEDTYKVEKEPYFGYMRGAYTKPEIHELDEYARLFGLELRPFIQTLAHLNQITRYEEYAEIIDTDDILLAGDKRTEEFLDHLIAGISDSFSSRNINIGMDEAHMVGLGKYLDRHGYEDRAMIMQKHLSLVLSICQKYGLHPQMWSDMFFRLAFHGEYYVKETTDLEQIKIPQQLELGYWDYYSQNEEHYDKMLKMHLQLTENTIFAGGAWKWTGFAPHNRYSIEAGRAALSACKKNHIHTVIITCWGDDGAEASIFSVLPTLYQNAIQAYDSTLKSNAFRILSGYEMEEFLLLDDVNPYMENEEIHNNASKYLLYNDPLIGTFDSVIKEDTAECFQHTKERLLDIMDRGGLYYLFETQSLLCNVLEKKADLGKRIRSAYISNDREKLQSIAQLEIEEILSVLDKFYKVFRDQWLRENKSFGFEVQTVRLGGLKQRILDVRTRIMEFLSGETDTIEELEESYLPFGYFKEDKIETLNYNLWTDIVSPSKI